MNRTLKRILIVAALAVLGVGAWLFTVRQTAPLEAVVIDRELKELLDRRPIAEFELREATLDQAIAVLNRELSNRRETAHLRVARWNSPSPPPGYHRREPGSAELPSTPSPVVNPDEIRLSLYVKNLPLSTAVSYVALMSDREPGRMENTIYLIEGHGVFGPMPERIVKLTSLKIGGFPRDPKGAEEYLRAAGIGFPEGSELRLISRDRMLIRNTQEQMDAIEYVLEPEFELTLRERLGYWFSSKWEGIREKLGFPVPPDPAMPPPPPLDEEPPVPELQPPAK